LSGFLQRELWGLHDKDLMPFDTAWRKVVRRLWQLPYRAHSALLPHLMFGRKF